MRFSKQTKGALALISLTFNFGLLAVLIKYIYPYFSLFQQLYITIGIAFVLGLILFAKQLNFAKIRKIELKDWTIVLIRASFAFLVGTALYRQSLALTKVSNVVFLQSIPSTAILGFILFKEKITLKKIFYILIAFFGINLIAIKDFSSVLNFGKGEFFALISGFIFSFGFLSRKWMSDHLNNQEITQLVAFFAFIMTFIVSFLVGEKIPIFNWSLTLTIAVILIGLLNIVDIYLINYGFQKVPPVLASNLLTLEAVFGTAFALLLFREIPTLKELTGGILIVISAVQMNRLESEKN